MTFELLFSVTLGWRLYWHTQNSLLIHTQVLLSANEVFSVLIGVKF